MYIRMRLPKLREPGILESREPGILEIREPGILESNYCFTITLREHCNNEVVIIDIKL